MDNTYLDYHNWYNQQNHFDSNWPYNPYCKDLKIIQFYSILIGQFWFYETLMMVNKWTRTKKEREQHYKNQIKLINWRKILINQLILNSFQCWWHKSVYHEDIYGNSCGRIKQLKLWSSRKRILIFSLVIEFFLWSVFYSYLWVICTLLFGKISK